jgi:hypothetical protein
MAVGGRLVLKRRRKGWRGRRRRGQTASSMPREEKGMRVSGGEGAGIQKEG